jgi:hypothetical protein
MGIAAGPRKNLQAGRSHQDCKHKPMFDRTLSWTFREILETSKITLTLKKERRILPTHKAEALVQLSHEDFLAPFWRNECSLNGINK